MLIQKLVWQRFEHGDYTFDSDADNKSEIKSRIFQLIRILQLFSNTNPNPNPRAHRKKMSNLILRIENISTFNTDSKCQIKSRKYSIFTLLQGLNPNPNPNPRGFTKKFQIKFWARGLYTFFLQ